MEMNSSTSTYRRNDTNRTQLSIHRDSNVKIHDHNAQVNKRIGVYGTRKSKPKLVTKAQIPHMSISGSRSKNMKSKQLNDLK